ncbi:MAG: fibronectin type III domain-containing protein [candidate division Zixibacteria bacterium]
MIKKYVILAISILVAMFLLSCSEEIESPSGVSGLPAEPEAPRGLTAAIGEGSITLSWGVSDASAISQYFIYYSDSSSSDMSLLDSTQNLSYEVTGLSNGVGYFFRVSALTTTGYEGEKSRAVSATPGIFSILINNGDEYTNDRTITIALTAPALTSLVQFSESSDFNSAHWEDFSAMKGYLLSDGDEMKRVYARFQTRDGGNSSGMIADSIILDRYAVIDSVTENSGGAVLTVGDTVHISLYTSESGGEASVNIDGIGNVALNDLGLSGDGLADDGIYEIDYVLPVGTELLDAEITGSFTDAAGNRASDVKAGTRLTATFPPDPVTLTGYTESSLEVLLQWTRSAISDFSFYRIFRDENPGIDESSYLVTTISSQSTTSFQDTALADTTAYYYRVFVYDSHGNSSGSNELEISTLKNTPPDAITVAVGLTGEALAVEVSWLQSYEDDFASYHLLRDSSLLTGYDSDLVVGIFNTQTTTSVTDYLPAAGTYYYQIFIFDKQGLMAGSNIVSINIP